jgi:hypothetical protein
MKQISGYEIVFEGHEKVPFGYEKKPTFENFQFHTLGYGNIGCFSLMKHIRLHAPLPSPLDIPRCLRGLRPCFWLLFFVSVRTNKR